MITISATDCRKIVELLGLYGEHTINTCNLREWNKGRQSRQLVKKLNKKLSQCSMK